MLEDQRVQVHTCIHNYVIHDNQWCIYHFLWRCDLGTPQSSGGGRTIQDEDWYHYAQLMNGINPYEILEDKVSMLQHTVLLSKVE